MTTETATPTIEAALLALSSQDDDRASTRNGAGFSKHDTTFGNSLADQVRSGKTLTPRQRAAAWYMLTKYRTQLAGHGIEYTEIPRPEPPPPPTLARKVEIAGDDFLLAFEFNQAIGNAVRGMPDERSWDATGKVWKVANTPGNVAILDAVIRQYRFTVSEEAVDALRVTIVAVEEKRAAQRELVEASIAESADLEVSGLGPGCVLRPFQKAGIAYLVRQKRSFLADDMGIGKTIQALATIQMLDAYPCVIVCPATLKGNWYRELRKWLPARRVTVLSGKVRALDPSIPQLFALDNAANFYVVNYDILDSWVVTLRARGVRSVILDESHYVKSSRARRSKAARALCKDLETVLCLTGTPVLNRPDELIAPLQIMNRLGDLGGYSDFRARYVDRAQPNLGELNERMRAVAYVRRTKSQVLTELPPKQRGVVPLSLDNRKEYDRAETDLIAYLRTIDVEKAKRAAWAEQLVKIEVCKQLAARGKMKQAIAWIEDFLEDGTSKLVVFAWHKEFVSALADHFKAPRIDGSTSLIERDRNVDAFQNDPNVRLLVANIQAGGVGITLTASSSVAFLELGWTPAIHDQAEDRGHRIGQRDTVNAYYLLAPNTIDERIQKLIDSKRLVVEAATDGRVSTEQSILSDLIADLRGEAPPVIEEEYEW